MLCSLLYCVFYFVGVVFVVVNECLCVVCVFCFFVLYYYYYYLRSDVKWPSYGDVYIYIYMDMYIIPGKPEVIFYVYMYSTYVCMYVCMYVYSMAPPTTTTDPISCPPSHHHLHATPAALNLLTGILFT